VIRTAFVQPTRQEAVAQWRETADRLRQRFEKLGALMDESEADVLAFMGSPEDHWKKIASANPLERVNKEIKRRSNVRPYPRPGSFPNDAAIMRLVGALIVEQNEEWHLTRRYMSNESLAKVIKPDPENKLLETREVA
jgi:putative transposase